MSEFPSHWTKCLLGERVHFEYGKSPNEVRCSDGKYPVYGSSGKTALATNYTTESPAIIVGRKGTIDKPIFLQERCWAIDTTFFIDNFLSDEPRYLYYLLDSINLKSLNESTGVPSLSRDTLHSIPVSLPPLPEQKKIAKILSGIDNMLHLTLQQLSRITKLRQSIYKSYLEGDQFRQHQSHEFTMGELAHGRHGIVDGPFGSNLKTEHYKESGIPVIQSGFVTSGKFVAENYKYVDRAKYEEQKRSSVSGGDLVMAKIGANAGRSALIPFGHPTAILAGNCLKITPNENLITKEYLAELMNHCYFSGRLADITNTTAQPAVSMSQLKKLSAFIPAIADQKKICSSLHSLDAVASCWENKHLKIILIKKSLCSDLLSGRKRVSI